MVAGIGAIVLMGVLTIAMQSFQQQQFAAAKRAFFGQEHAETLAVKARTEDMFRELYQNLRTIARLPGVRAIGRHGEQFDADAKTTVQEFYNSLAGSVPISEFYIVPIGMDPDQLDPVTGRNQEPILTFDQLIVGKVGGANAAGEDHPHDEPELEETEIHEYRLMKRQLEMLAAKYPVESAFEGLGYPAVCGPQVVTCDNSLFDPAHPDDEDRSGIVYSIPFYGANGSLKGSISAVLLTPRLAAFLGDNDRAIVNAASSFAAIGVDAGGLSGAAARFKSLVEAASAPGDVLYSEVLPLQIAD
ncbi:MAG: hypothetical protein NTV94_14535, partial [Planctomycetota bacterium]|nr:hypothetical protein [Planctomycetota bacterium]